MTTTSSASRAAVDTTTAVYVFAVCPRRAAPDLAGVPGQPGGGSVRLLPAGALSAVVQEVPAGEFTEAALHDRLSDREELELCARAHHEVVAAVARSAAVVPLPMATLYLDEGRARQAVIDDAHRFVTALDRIEGHVEWGVKVHVGNGDDAGAGTTSRTGGPPPGEKPASGRAYLDRVRGRRQARENREEAALRIADRVDAGLRGVAVAARRLRLHGPEVTGKHRRQVLNAAYLVEAGRERELRERVEALGREPGFGDGVRVELTGPWVPYSFAEGGAADGHD
ncbi:GvpL/GvpF family gas vesicle protein [Streptomyces sodiiphilus]|uniref:GvpL/GvpF family gas vesicle protein n=1 Tax=Streptomyces sodiiphilus TaxID=226217 RepID=A0ABN2P258_9ACTN